MFFFVQVQLDEERFSSNACKTTSVWCQVES